MSRSLALHPSILASDFTRLEEELTRISTADAARDMDVLRAALGDAPCFQHHDLVGVDDRGEAVRDHERRAPDHEIVEARLHRTLGLGVEGGGRLVEEQEREAGEVVRGEVVTPGVDGGGGE